MNTTKLGGNPVSLSGDVPEAGAKAPDFTYVRENLSEKSLFALGSVNKVLIAVPSLDTGVCKIETRRFSKELSTRPGVVGLVISKDLPFAMKRFCLKDGIENIEIASDFRGSFAERYNTLITDGPFKGLIARAVFILDGDNNIRYSELVADIDNEPDYASALNALDAL
jgi:thiol peroxidase